MTGYRNAIFLLTSLLAVMAFTVNCSDVDFKAGSSTGNGGPDPFTDNIVSEPISVDFVQKSCDSGRVVQTPPITVEFADPGKVCEFGVGDNLGKQNGRFSARRVQAKALGLPKGAIICDAKFEFSPQDFWFDDVFILTLDQNILVSSYRFEENFRVQNGFYMYNWFDLQGDPWKQNQYSEDYCVGADQGLASCSFPAQHEFEPIRLSMDKRVIQNAMANSGQIDHAFYMITTGDNDDKDCRHFDMKFSVTFSYTQ